MSVSSKHPNRQGCGPSRFLINGLAIIVGRRRKKIFPHSRWIIYSSTDRTFTMPFVTQDFAEDRVVDDVWPEPWEFPFSMFPLGSPNKLVSLEAAKRSWSILDPDKNPTHCINGMNGRTVFVPNEIEDKEWLQILSDVGESPDTFSPPDEPYQRHASLGPKRLRDFIGQ
jgi:hypothetical protein